MFIVIITYIKSPEIVAQFRAAHRSYLDTGYEKNYLIASGPKTTADGGILLSQLTQRNVLEEFIKQDPFSLNEIATFEIVEFQAVKYHKNFANFVV